MRRALVLGTALLLVLAACGPEGQRVRGSSNLGADVGNHGSLLDIHGKGSETYYLTPNLNPRLAAVKK